MLVMALLGLGAVSPAGADGGLDDRIRSCRAVVEPASRLACFDAIDSPAAAVSPAVQPMPVPVTPRAPVAPTITAAPPQVPATTAAVPHDGTFGSEQVVVEIKSDAPKVLKAKAVGNFDGIRKGQSITLDNGQIWLDVDDRSYDYEAVAPTAIIERNFMGNYWMKLADSSFRFRVRRVK